MAKSKKFEVLVGRRTEMWFTVEAQDETEAREIAQEMDPSEADDVKEDDTEVYSCDEVK